MKLLMHACCGPCSIYPLQALRDDRHQVMGFYYRNNIHPYTECLKREQTLMAFAESRDLKMIVQTGYDMETFLRNVAFREADRCTYCYHERLTTTAHLAKKGRFDGFTTTLLYSRYQKHDQIRSIGDSVGKSARIPFYYQDFRDGWTAGIEQSRQMGMYRQAYCGCIYSEKARFYHPPKRPGSPSSSVEPPRVPHP
jgi:predicted adenine nucleotide alpha hydrolase (AANH) superfamily ATPase